MPGLPGLREAKRAPVGARFLLHFRQALEGSAQIIGMCADNNAQG